ncbi:hypothetical protein F5884DRAFT_676080 [Xylogone sp. PMI_703]|nr:hypothetical protein F5884DRAFT_676080 [Xylogone sp. PMI_703]
MAASVVIRYTPEELLHLRDSPLVAKPPGLPPVEQWMGPPVENNARKVSDHRSKPEGSTLLEQTGRRSGVERHMSRNSANPDDIILGPPKTSFMSSTSARNNGSSYDSDRPSMRDADSRDRYSYRGKGFDADGERMREGRSNMLRPKPNDGEQDSDGWSTVKSRKSFGAEGAERFNIRSLGDKDRDDRRFRDREDKNTKERPVRGFDSYSRDSRDKDHDHAPEGNTRRNGAGRGRSEPSWFRDNNETPSTPRDRTSNGDKITDRSRGWRDRDERPSERTNERGDRRWDRDREQRQEKEPEWMDEPAEGKSHGHTQEDFEKWKEAMAGKDGKSTAGKASREDKPMPDLNGQASFFGLENPKAEPLLPIDTGPDKFFVKFLGNKEESDPKTPSDVATEGLPKSRPTGKASRFTSFFSPQEEAPRRQPELASPQSNGLGALFSSPTNDQSSAEKEAFQALLQKLQRQSMGNTSSTPPADASQQPKPPGIERIANIPLPPDAYHPYRGPEILEDQRSSTQNSQQQALQELLNQRNAAGSQPTIRPDQMLQELVGQRQNALSQTSIRSDQSQSRNRNTEFLMGLMQGSKTISDPQRTEQLLAGLRPLQKPVDSRQLQQQLLLEREQEMQREAQAQRERSASQRQVPPPPPGFFDEASFPRRPMAQHEPNSRNPPQPTQILQRQPPPGLEQLPPNWAPPPGQIPLPQQRHIAPPPGLAGVPNRGMPMPQQMFPPGFPMQNFLPPEPPMGGPPRNMQPPPGFFNGPPPGFLPPGMSGFQSPEGVAFGPPFDGRGPPPQGGFRRQ